MLVDTREPKKLKEYFSKHGFKITKLDIGDYQINGFYIERKRISEFMQSLYNGRLFNQLYALNSVNGILLLHNIWERIDDKQFNKILARLKVLYKNISIILVKGEQDMKEFILSMAEATNKPSGERPIKFHKKSKIIDMIEDMFTAIRGIGRKTSKDIITKGYSIRELSNKSKDELQLLLGNKVGERIYIIFNFKYSDNGNREMN